jgi:hypothetical protein
MSKGATAVFNLAQLNVPVPPMLAKAMGYRGAARYVSFQWTPYGDEADYSDGRGSGTGDWQGYLAFIQHPAVSPQLQGYDFGSSDSEAKHALILDQEQQILFVAPARDAEKFLQEQWPKAPTARMSKEEYNALVMKALKNLSYARDISMKEVERRIAEHHALIKEMEQWLDKQLKN